MRRIQISRIPRKMILVTEREKYRAKDRKEHSIYKGLSEVSVAEM